MDLLTKTKELCRIYEIKPARSKGQNFLIKEDAYEAIINAAELKDSETVLEVGPGLGFLTAKLAKQAKKVVAVELDDKLAEVLKTAVKAQGIKNVEVINENILDFKPPYPPLQGGFSNKVSPFQRGIKGVSKGGLRGFKIVANLPYNITSVFLRKFLSEAKNKPELMVLMLQKEVAERIAAKPGDMSLLAVSVQFYAEPEIIKIVPADHFWPQPEVDSAIIRLRVKPPCPPLQGGSSECSSCKGGEMQSPLPLPDQVEDRLLSRGRNANEREFFRLVKIGFSSRRKMLKNNLANGYHVAQAEAENWIKRAGFEPKIRAQELSIENWKKLLEVVSVNVV